MATLARELHVIDQAHDRLGLQLKQIALILGADESTLHRWRDEDEPVQPSKAYRARLLAFEEFLTELRDAFSSWTVAKRWLWEKHPVPLGGKTPLEALLAGKLERVSALLWSDNNGMPA